MKKYNIGFKLKSENTNHSLWAPCTGNPIIAENILSVLNQLESFVENFQSPLGLKLIGINIEEVE